MFDEDENSEKTPSRPKAFSLLRCENIGDRIREIPLTKSKKHIMMRRMRRARKDSVPPEGFITPHAKSSHSISTLLVLTCRNEQYE